MPDGGSSRRDDLPGKDPRLGDAIAAGNLALVYQPELDLVTGTVSAVEALTRWHHPEYGELSPLDFIAEIEQLGQMQQLGAWTMENALATYAGWRAVVPGLDVVLRLNVSPAQLSDPSTAAELSAALSRHGVRPSAVCVEITERAPFGYLDELADAIMVLRELGVTCAIDDLASGYSTLGALRSLPVDVVKVDRSLVADIDLDARARTIVLHVLRMAADLGATVVAEGVENEQELAVLKELGCTRVQGHHLSRPLDAQSMAVLLDARGRRVTRPVPGPRSPLRSPPRPRPRPR